MERCAGAAPACSVYDVGDGLLETASTLGFEAAAVSEEDDFVAVLAEQMAHSMLEDAAAQDEYKLERIQDWRVSSSTLSFPAASYLPRRSTSLLTPVQPLSPSDLLSIAAEEMKRLKAGMTHQPQHSQTHASTDKHASSSQNHHFQQHQVLPERGLREHDCKCCRNGHNQAAAASSNFPRRGGQHQQAMRHPSRNDSSNNISVRRNSSQASTSQSQHSCAPQGGSGMRALFLKTPGVRSASTGTGVFLPQTAAYNAKRKPSCSTVLLPSRMVDALQLNSVDELRHHHHDPSYASREAETHPSTWNSHTASPTRLPTEWTY